MKKISQGICWSYGERFLAQFVSFIVSIVLSRLITPEEFGLVSLVMIFIGICNVFVTNGLGTGLIQKKNADEIDFSTVFWMSLVLSIIIYIILFIIAPYLEYYLRYSKINKIIRILGIRIIIASVNTIQHAYVSRNMIFKKFFFSTLFGTIISAFIGIILAINGFGVWALVIQYLTNTTIDTLFLAMTINWHPKLMFKVERVKYFFEFGWKVLVASLIENLYTNLRSFIISKRYSTSELAYYNKGTQFPLLIVSNINSSIITVLFPALSMKQDERENMRIMVKKSVELSSFLLSPLLIGMIIVAKSLVLIILTEKWIKCIPYIYIFSFAYLFMPIHAINAQAIKATGHSEISLKIEIIKKIIGISIIILTIIYYNTPKALAVSFLLYSIIALIINSWPGKELYNYKCIEQIKDVFKPLILSCIMGCIIFQFSFFINNKVLLIFVQVISGLIIYYILSKVFRIPGMLYINLLINKKTKV